MSQFSIMDGIADYLQTNIANQTELRYVGLLPGINTSGDFRNLPPGLFPFVGVSLQEIDYQSDYSMGSNSPIWNVQFIFSVRVSGVQVAEDQAVMLGRTQELETMILTQSRTTLFNVPEILGARLTRMVSYPTFYTEVQSNRKAFGIGLFDVELYMESI